MPSLRLEFAQKTLTRLRALLPVLFLSLREGHTGIMGGLDFWPHNLNIFRDPRWGQGQETYGEDPFLTGRMGVAYVAGLQGIDPKYYFAIATPKHYAVPSGPEPTRHFADVDVSRHNEVDTYEPAAGQPIGADVTVTNTGNLAGDEVVKLYLKFPDVKGAPRVALRGFKRIHLDPGANQRSISISRRATWGWSLRKGIRSSRRGTTPSALAVVSQILPLLP